MAAFNYKYFLSTPQRCASWLRLTEIRTMEFRFDYIIILSHIYYSRHSDAIVTLVIFPFKIALDAVAHKEKKHICSLLFCAERKKRKTTLRSLMKTEPQTKSGVFTSSLESSSISFACPKESYPIVSLPAKPLSPSSSAAFPMLVA